MIKRQIIRIILILLFFVIFLYILSMPLDMSLFQEIN